MKKKRENLRLNALKVMLWQWLSRDGVRATRYYKEIEQQRDSYERGYRAALGDIIRKIEDDNY